MILYRYLYYRLYTWNLKTWGIEDMPQWNALYGVSFMMFLNLGFVALLLQILGLDIFYNSTPKLEIIIVALLLLLLNYYFFIRKKKYLLHIKRFEKETSKKRKINTLLLWLYVLSSFLIFVLGAYVLSIKSGNT